MKKSAKENLAILKEQYEDLEDTKYLKILKDTVKLLQNETNKSIAKQLLESLESYEPSEEDEEDEEDENGKEEEDEENEEREIDEADESIRWNLLLQYCNKRKSEEIDLLIIMPSLTENKINGIELLVHDPVSLDELKTKKDIQMLSGYYFRPKLDVGGDMYSLLVEINTVHVHVWSNKLGSSPVSIAKKEVKNRCGKEVYRGLVRSKEKLLESLKRCGYREINVHFHYHLLTSGGVTMSATSYLNDLNVKIHTSRYFWENAIPKNMKKWIQENYKVLSKERTMRWIFVHLEK